MKNNENWDKASSDVQEKMIEEAFHSLVSSGFIQMIDEPMEETPGYEMAYEKAIETFNELFPLGVSGND